MYDKKMCPMSGLEDIDGRRINICILGDCAIYDDQRGCCGLRQISNAASVTVSLPQNAPRISGGKGKDGADNER